ncbi:hypothetical protein OF83DRAFT_1051028 [Amylostereum chailletii]|nr:hypothetical protein OF83DRAFT_1051028 [Amylostereum chailletii]
MPLHTAKQIETVSRRTVEILQSHGLPCCLVGSSATTLWGVNRVPNDIDVFVMSPAHTQEQLKQLLAVDPAYTLKPSANPQNTYKVVWYTIPGISNIQIKVDILVPPVMNIPWVAASRFVWFKNKTLPSMPLLPLLLLKLQAWDDHRNHHLSNYRSKQFIDVQDITHLLDIAMRKGIHRTDSEWEWLPASFLREGRRRVWLYTNFYPASSGSWAAIGFEKAVLIESYGIQTSERSSTRKRSRRRRPK